MFAIRLSAAAAVVVLLTLSRVDGCRDRASKHLGTYDGAEFSVNYAEGVGHCGVYMKSSEFTAGISPYFFDTTCQWDDNKNTDPTCKGLCVQVQYKGQTLGLTVNNMCSGCNKSHILVSKDAFKELEPAPESYGHAEGAVLRYYYADDCTKNNKYKSNESGVNDPEERDSVAASSEEREIDVEKSEKKKTRRTHSRAGRKHHSRD